MKKWEPASEEADKKDKSELEAAEQPVNIQGARPAAQSECSPVNQEKTINIKYCNPLMMQSVMMCLNKNQT